MAADVSSSVACAGTAGVTLIRLVTGRAVGVSVQPEGVRELARIVRPRRGRREASAALKVRQRLGGRVENEEALAAHEEPFLGDARVRRRQRHRGGVALVGLVPTGLLPVEAPKGVLGVCGRRR